MCNPFTIALGRRPLQNIERTAEKNRILESFQATQINQQIYMITGTIGSGKTVLMTDISNRLRTYDNWTVIELNPEIDMLHSLAAKLSQEERFREAFHNAKINLSLLGLGLEIDGAPSIADDETAIIRMLESISKNGNRVLVTVDEVTNNGNVRKFLAAFHLFIRKELPVFLLMTGLFESIAELKQQKACLLHTEYRIPFLNR